MKATQLRIMGGLFAMLMVTHCVRVACGATPPIVSLAVAPDDAARSILAGSQAGIQRFDLETLRPLELLAVELGIVHDLAFSPDGRWLAACGGLPAEIGRLHLYRWPSMRLAAVTAQFDDVLYAVSWRADSRQLAVACHDSTVAVCELAYFGENGTDEAQPVSLNVAVHPAHSRPVRSVAYADNKTLVSASADRSLRVWRTGLAKPVRILNQHTDAVWDLRSRPTVEPTAPPTLASASADRTVRIWQPTIGRLVRFVRLDAVPLAICWTADGRLLAAACDDGAVCGIDPQSTRVLSRKPVLDGWAYAIVATDNQRVIVGGSDGQLRSVDLRSTTPADSSERAGAIR